MGQLWICWGLFTLGTWEQFPLELPIKTQEGGVCVCVCVCGCVFVCVCVFVGVCGGGGGGGGCVCVCMLVFVRSFDCTLSVDAGLAGRGV